MPDNEKLRAAQKKIVNGLMKIAPDDFDEELKSIKAGLSCAAAKITGKKAETTEGPIPVDKVVGKTFKEGISIVVGLVQAGRGSCKEIKDSLTAENAADAAERTKAAAHEIIGDSLSGLTGGIKAIRDAAVEKVPAAAPVFDAIGVAAEKAGELTGKAVKAAAQGSVAAGKSAAGKLSELKESGAFDRAAEKLAQTTSGAKKAIASGAAKTAKLASDTAKNAVEGAAKISAKTQEKARSKGDGEGVSSILKSAEEKIKNAANIKGISEKVSESVSGISGKLSEKIAEVKQGATAPETDTASEPKANPFEKLAAKAKQLAEQTKEKCATAAQDAKSAIAEKKAQSAEPAEAPSAEGESVASKFAGLAQKLRAKAEKLVVNTEEEPAPAKEAAAPAPAAAQPAPAPEPDEDAQYVAQETIDADSLEIFKKTSK